MATNSSILAWVIPWTEEPGEGRKRVRHDFPGGSGVKNLPANAGGTGDAGSILGSGRSPGEGNGNQLQYSCLGNPMARRDWQATIHGIEKELGTT